MRHLHATLETHVERLINEIVESDIATSDGEVNEFQRVLAIILQRDLCEEAKKNAD